MSNTGAHAHTGVHEDYISISNRGMIIEGRGAQPQLVYLSSVPRGSPAFSQNIIFRNGSTLGVESDSGGLETW